MMKVSGRSEASSCPFFHPCLSGVHLPERLKIFSVRLSPLRSGCGSNSPHPKCRNPRASGRAWSHAEMVLRAMVAIGVLWSIRDLKVGV